MSSLAQVEWEASNYRGIPWETLSEREQAIWVEKVVSDQYAQRANAAAEHVRVSRWHATRDAVLGHLYDGDTYDAARFSTLAQAAADLEHGPLVKPGGAP